MDHGMGPINFYKPRRRKIVMFAAKLSENYATEAINKQQQPTNLLSKLRKLMKYSAFRIAL